MRRLAACLLAVFATLVVVAPPSQATGPVRYVALGDSYSAASGVLPPDPTAPPQCLRSTANYPHVIAAATGAQLTDVTCGGADTGDYLTGQYPGVAPQLDAVSRDTQVVTMTIGGNDSGVFINSILRCGAAGLTTLGTGSPCRDRYGSSFEDTIRTTTYPSLVQVLKAVRAKAPHAEVAILGYPSILPATRGCFPDAGRRGRRPLPAGRPGDAERRDPPGGDGHGLTFVDLSRVSEGHDACQPIGVRWIEPVLVGTNPVIVHPNALGEAQMAARAMAVMRRL